MATKDQSLAPPVLTPISIVPHTNTVDESNTIGYVEQSEEPPEPVTTSSDAPNLTNESGPCMTSLPKHNVAPVYYKVLNPEGDDIVHISHENIMSRSCSVSVQNLSENDIKELQETHRSGKMENESNSDSPSSSEQKLRVTLIGYPHQRERSHPVIDHVNNHLEQDWLHRGW